LTGRAQMNATQMNADENVVDDLLKKRIFRSLFYQRSSASSAFIRVQRFH
jgi:hypothetical protein